MGTAAKCNIHKIRIVKKHKNKSEAGNQSVQLNAVNWILVAFPEYASTLLSSGAELMSSTKPFIVKGSGVKRHSSVFLSLIAAIMFWNKAKDSVFVHPVACSCSIRERDLQNIQHNNEGKTSGKIVTELSGV